MRRRFVFEPFFIVIQRSVSDEGSRVHQRTCYRDPSLHFVPFWMTEKRERPLWNSVYSVVNIPKRPVSEGCKVAVAKCQSYAFRMEQKTQPATRNFFRFSFGVRVCVCVPYIYKIKKIIYYIELRYTRPLRVGKNTTSKSKAQPGCKLRSCNKVLWEILHDNGYYAPTLSNWNSQIR